MLGSYSVENGVLMFRPRFPVSPGLRVVAVFQPPDGSAVRTVFDAAKQDLTPSTHVRHIYPSTDLLPSNQLKFYLHFSAPMQRSEVWRRLRLLDAKGSLIDLPFLEIDQELWDPSYKRLTVLFDPGRIKRGVLPLEEVGAAIEEGKQYTLVVDREWKDARGAPLTGEFRKSFRVGPAARMALDPADWRLTSPTPGTYDPLVVDFPTSMDSALLVRVMKVRNVPGETSLDRNETRWAFVPKERWKPGEYQLLVDHALEDLAGNRIGRPFDVDVFETVTRRVVPKTTSLSFRVRDE